MARRRSKRRNRDPHSIYSRFVFPLATRSYPGRFPGAMGQGPPPWFPSPPLRKRVRVRGPPQPCPEERGRASEGYASGFIKQSRFDGGCAGDRWRTRGQHRRHHAGAQGSPSRAAGTSPFPARSHRRIAPPLQYARAGGAWRPACPSASGVPAQMGCDHGLGSRKNTLELVFSRDEPEISAHLPSLAPTLRSVTPGQ
jgi:hypothetical protein